MTATTAVVSRSRFRQFDDCCNPQSEDNCYIYLLLHHLWSALYMGGMLNIIDAYHKVNIWLIK